MAFIGYTKNIGKYLAGAAAVLGLGFFLSQSPAQPERPVEKDFRYAVIVGQDAYNRKDWKKPTDRLVEKHDGRIFVWDEQIEEVLSGLKEYQPTHAACVGRPSEFAIPELGNNMQSELNAVENSLAGRFYRMLDQLDDDPYPDAIGGIVTGYTAEDALRIVNTGNFNIDTVLGKGFEPPIYMARNGLVFGEAKDHNIGEDKPRMVKRIIKTEGNIVIDGVETAGEEFLDFLNTKHPGLVGFGGHAGGDNLYLGYGYQDAVLLCKGGKVYAVMPPDKLVGEIKSENPKVYISSTNCRYALIKNKEEALSLAFIHSGGGAQVFGLMSDAVAIKGMEGNYIGHGFKAHLIETSDNPTFFEALKMAQISNAFALDKVRRVKRNAGVPEQQILPEEFDKIYGQHAFIGIGDPATEIKIERDPKFEPLANKKAVPKLNEDGTITYRFELRTQDRQVTLQRPPVYLLPKAINTEGVKIESSSKDLVFVITDDFVILDVGESLVPDNNAGIKLNHSPIQAESIFELEITAKVKGSR